MISVNEVIHIFIQYRGARQHLFTDYGTVFDNYLEFYQEELKNCSLFEHENKANALTIRYRDQQFIIYSTDGKATKWGVEYVYNTEEEATKKFLKLYELSKI